MSIRINYDKNSFRVRDSGKIRRFLDKVVRENCKIPGDLNFIFTDDEYLTEINVEFLNHNYLTDVITFDFCTDKVMNGEIYISYERVKENSINYNVSLKDEVLRVMIHGILHLAGFRDGTAAERNDMREAEDLWLSRYKEEQ